MIGLKLTIEIKKKLPRASTNSTNHPKLLAEARKSKILEKSLVFF